MRTCRRHTTSLDEPSGLRVKVKMDSKGRHYVVEPLSGMRFDISDDETIPTQTPFYAPATAPYRHPHTTASATARSRTSPSETSDMVLSGSTNPGALLPGIASTTAGSITPTEDALDTLIGQFSISMTPEQKTTLNHANQGTQEPNASPGEIAAECKSTGSDLRDRGSNGRYLEGKEKRAGREQMEAPPSFYENSSVAAVKETSAAEQPLVNLAITLDGLVKP
ncbi:hypothetical protein B0H13DRAFT_1896257 [Mycena leptocephala]|nr:hypothetical protein B0H13DRAFT_1896257 [Mycena leptocephala]